MSLADKKINTNQITTVGVQGLTDRPNQSLEYGGNNLTAAQLKARFDALPTIIIDAFNTLVGYLGTEAFASDLKTSDATYTTLAALVTAIRNGGFANILKVSAEKNQTLKEFSASVENGTLANNLILVFGNNAKKGLMEAISDGTLANKLQIDVDDTLQTGTESLTGFCTNLLESFISAFDTEDRVSHNVLNPDKMFYGMYLIRQGVVTENNDVDYMRTINPIQIPSGSTKVYISTDIPPLDAYTTYDTVQLTFMDENGAGLVDVLHDIKNLSESDNEPIRIRDGATQFHVSIGGVQDHSYRPKNFCVSFTDGFEKYTTVQTPVKLKKEFLPSDLGVVNPATPNGNLVKWDAENKKLVDAGIGELDSAFFKSLY